MKCTICHHPKRQAIDKALMAKSDTLEALSQTYGLSTSALHRHKAHLQAKIARSRLQVQDNLFHGCLFWLAQALEMSMQTAQAARDEGNHKIVLQALAQGTRLIKIILKQDFHFDDKMVYQILTSPQWGTQTGFLPTDPQILAAGREALSGSILTPCSEHEEPPPPSASAADLDLAAVQAMLANLAPLPAIPSKTANGKSKTANSLVKKREKGGNFPAYDCYVFDKEEENQMLELEKKIAHLDFDAILQGLPPAAASAKEEAILEHLYNCEPIPEGKSLAEYLHEQSLL